MDYSVKKVVASEADIAAIDFDMCRTEIERKIGKGRSDALLKVIAVLRRHGDDSSLVREIYHYAYFNGNRNARRFGSRLQAKGYKLLAILNAENSQRCVKFFHMGQSTVESIAQYERPLPLMAKRRGGSYDGWETSIECGVKASAHKRAA